MIENQLFFPMLVKEIPEYFNQYQEHLEYYGELLSHVLLADFMRWLFSLHSRCCNINIAKNDVVSLGIIRRSALFLDTALESGDEGTKELIYVSFIENLWQARENYSRFVSLLGPIMQKEIAKYDEYLP